MLTIRGRQPAHAPSCETMGYCYETHTTFDSSVVASSQVVFGATHVKKYINRYTVRRAPPVEGGCMLVRVRIVAHEDRYSAV